MSPPLPARAVGPCVRAPFRARARRRPGVAARAAAEGLPVRWSEPERAPLRVALLLSGGVDSSVALRLAQAAGHEVTAFYLQIWFVEDFRNTWSECPWEEDLGYARAVAKQAGVPLEVVPLSTEYWDEVVKHTVGEVAKGRTPNPDVLCNSRIKFGAFWRHIEETYGSDRFDRIASGHYARLSSRSAAAAEEEPVRLMCSGDDHKDQTYFLAHLSQAQLARAMFPLGGLDKPEVREIAEKLNLPTAGRKDSQGICFLGKVKYSEFVAEHLGERPGPIVVRETGEQIGEHRGVWFHTIGQRQGLGPLQYGPWYVSGKDASKDIVYVSHGDVYPREIRDRFVCDDIEWIGGAAPEAGVPLEVKVRHGKNRHECTLALGSGLVRTRGSDKNGFAPGQYAVFYAGDECVGCGIIRESGAGGEEEAEELAGAGAAEAVLGVCDGEATAAAAV
mmetsp:Transcript_5524/g.19010  ORF Transcript_5524/g.19010 Transcript_5524/m.19010 type:complete len:447 (+) Transcript_5524:84-1424(+)|eukprot:CAMPEP_0170158554 /NCGR_PEP_ID=MMETSP0033_2-20121228/68548_1 /TAXON_ID=195969 /ORGANISM="Dolichomastix tenuilepis, Strain CCMP3274" /LENGTH=446 /DNA_ID=CAMNT_0010395997 /DNA_START=62 /DNA_END=1402 /DNA_ORIENTATION=+